MSKIIFKINAEENKCFLLRFQRKSIGTIVKLTVYLGHKPLRRKPSRQFYVHQYGKLLISLGFHFSILLSGTTLHTSHKLRNIKVTSVALGVAERESITESHSVFKVTY